MLRRGVARLSTAGSSTLVERTGDLGAVQESVLAERYWPGGEQPLTGAPLFSPSGGVYDAPIDVAISSPSEGASISYTLDESEEPEWQLYVESVVVEGDATLRARAVRYGYAESGETRSRFVFVSQ